MKSNAALITTATATTTDVTLQGGLDAANELQLYTSPGGVVVDSITIDSDTRVALKDFPGWTMDATHTDAGVTITWARDNPNGEAWYTFVVTSNTTFTIASTASSTAATEKKKKRIYITVTPTSSGLMQDVAAPLAEVPAPSTIA